MLRYSFENDKPQKLSRKLGFQLKMHLNEHLCECPHQTFSLRAVVAHMGLSPDQGHYVTYAKHKKKWFMFDDDVVQVVEEDAIMALAGGSATGFLGYVLIYEAEE